MANGIRTGGPLVNSIKDVVRSPVKVSGGHIDRNVVEITIKNEDSSPKTFNDKNQQVSLRNLAN